MRSLFVVLVLPFVSACGAENASVQLGDELRLTNAGAQRIAFTGFVVAGDGSAKPYYYGMLGVDKGVVSVNVPPPEGSALRLRFTIAKAEGHRLGAAKLGADTSVIAGATGIPEIGPDGNNLEFVYRGGPKVLRVAVENERVVMHAD